jgi:SNF2 family DNA or RNA helicase
VGVIARSAVRKFEQRERSDYRAWKKYSADELATLRDALPIKPPVWKPLRLHQKVCLLIGAAERQFGFFLDTGMGKTFLTIALFRYWLKLAKKPRRWLILVPNKTNKKEWEREVLKHAPDLDILRLTGSTANKWADLEALGPHSDLIVETYAGLMHLVSERVPDERRAAKKKKAKGGKSKMRMKWSDKRIDQLCEWIDGLVLDESIKVMNKSALPHRICYQIRKRLGEHGFAYELNGTPFGRDPLSIWGQVYLLDLGHSLGETLGLYRATFFKEVKGRFGFPEHHFDKSKQKQLHNFLADRTIAYEADEGDLPKVQPIVKKIYLPADAEHYAEEAKRRIIAAKGDYIESKNAFMRMRQISSGWLGYKDDETGERASVNFRPNLKLEYLLDYIETINPKYKWIVFHEFNYSGSLICDGLKEMGIKHEWVYGKSKDPEGSIEKFVNDPSVAGLVLSNSAGSYGLNLQCAKYGIYFEAPVSPIIRYQTRKRFERQYSPHKTVFRIDLVVSGTYDESILAFHEEGKDLFDAIIRGKFDSRRSLKAGSGRQERRPAE